MTDDGMGGFTSAGREMVFDSYDLLRRAGATEIQLRYQDDEAPVLWLMYARFQPAGHPTVEHVAAGLNPVSAIVALLAEAVDGGQCVACKRPTALVELGDEALPVPVSLVCQLRHVPGQGWVKGCQAATN